MVAEENLKKKKNKILSAYDSLKKEVIMANDFNINLLGFEQNKKVKIFVNINIWP